MPAPSPVSAPAGQPVQGTIGTGAPLNNPGPAQNVPSHHVPTGPHGTPVPAFLASEVHASQGGSSAGVSPSNVEVPRVFEDDRRRRRDEDLDIPDFLK